MTTLVSLLVGIAIGALSTAALASMQVGTADDAPRAALVAVKREIVASHQGTDRAVIRAGPRLDVAAVHGDAPDAHRPCHMTWTASWWA